MVKVVERKKKEKRGQPPLSDLGDPPLEEKQQRKLTRRDSVPAPLRQSRRLKPNPDADKIRHSKPEKRVRIHPKIEEKQVSSFDLNYNACPDITAEEIAFFEEHVLKKSDGFFVPSMHGVMAFRRALNLPPCMETKKKEKRGQPPLSNLGDPPLEEKQQQKQTRRALVLALHRRSRCLNPNPDADMIHHGKPEKQVKIHPKKEEKQVSSFDLNYNACPDITAEEIAFYEEHVLKKSDGFFVPSMHGVMAFRRALNLPPCMETKKKEKRGQPPLSNLGDPPLEENQQRKQTRRALVLAPHRRSRCLNPNPDADMIHHGKPEKRVKIHPKKEEKQVSSSDFYDDIRNWHTITAEECAFYEEHILKSDGFDVPSMRGVIAFGLIQPRTINTLVEARRFILYSNLAIDQYSTWIHTHKPESPQLKFRKVLKAMSQACDVMRYYITFAAKEVAAGGQTKTYQAVVRCGIKEDDITVLSFRECEQVEGSGILAKEWIWKGHAHI